MMWERLLHNLLKPAQTWIGFHPQKCLRARLNTNSCSLCLTVCPQKAISVQGRLIFFDIDRCTGCGLCVSACINDAFSNAISPEVILNSVSEIDNPVISCHRHGKRGNITVPCIGMLSEELLVAMTIISGCQVTVNTELCDSCDNKCGADFFFIALRKIQLSLPGEYCRKIHVGTDKHIRNNKNGTRRQYLVASGRKLHRALQSEIDGQQENTASDGVNRKSTTSSMVVLHKAKEYLGPDNSSVKNYLDGFYNKLTFLEECTGCPACAAICPTGSIVRRKIDREWKLDFCGDWCSGCRLCLEFCKKNALLFRQGSNKV